MGYWNFVTIKNHYLPRTVAGRKATVAFLLAMLCSQPPIVFWIDKEFKDTWFLGLPFLYGYLAFVYFVQIGILIWTLRKKV